MRSIEREFGDKASNEINVLLIDLVDETLRAAKHYADQDPQQFAKYRLEISTVCADQIYRVILKYRKEKRDGRKTVQRPIQSKSSNR